MANDTTSSDGMLTQAEALQAEMASLNRLADSFGVKMVNAFAGAIVHGRKFSDVLRGLALSLSQQALSAALKPLGNLLGSLIPNAHGNVISAGRVQPFAAGGIVNSPVLFPLRGGAGLMGEAGPEAIMPLARGTDGKLGLRVNGGAGPAVTVNITTPNPQAFEQSQTQVAALVARAVARGQRNM